MRHDPNFPSAADRLERLVEAELGAIERDPAFARAPVIRQLLRYLVAETLSGRGATLKSYAIAVDGLGKGPDFDSQADSYPRVQVGRLRKMLDTYYSANPPGAAIRIGIPSGSYHVTFNDGAQADGIGFPPAADVPPQYEARDVNEKAGPLRWILLAALIVAAIAVGASWLLADARRADAWATPNFPIVAIGEIAAIDGIPEQRLAAIGLRNSIIEMLSRFDALEVAEAPAATASYRLQGSLRRVEKGTLIQVSLLDVASGNVIWARSRVRERAAGQLFDVVASASSITAALAQPWGIVHSEQRARRVAVSTPYGCWLEAILLWNERSPASDRAVRSCTAEWKAGDPASSLALVSSAWLLVDDARREKGRERAMLLLQAKAEARRAVKLNPSSAVARFSVMHTALHSREFALLHEAADRVLRLNPNNPELAALVALHRIYAGDIAAAEPLKDAMLNLASPPQWYHTGLFFVAVMNDDPIAALHAARRVQTALPSVAQDAMLAMAEARLGQTENARQHWRRALAAAPMLGRNPALLFASWPVNPEMQRRSLAWLKPVL